MTGDPAPDFHALPDHLRAAVSAACDRFLAALRADPAARAEDHRAEIPGVPAGTLLRELLVTEIEFRTAADPGFDPAALYARLPGERDRVREAVALAAGPRGFDDPPLAGPDGEPVVVGDYRLRRLLGRGAFGAVFLATDLRTETDAAVKVPRVPALLDPAARGRFLHEARAAAALDHPHVVRLLEAGEDGAVCFLAAEYVAGTSLAGWLAARGGEPVPARLAAELLLPVAEAVAHAHARGVLHLDLKPANVLLGPGDTPKVADFGLARVAGEPSALSASGVLAGTPAYMAPEQVGGRREADARADVYALGAILYELLAGRPPVADRHLPGALARAARGYPEWPRRARPDVPREIEAVCLRCLERDPARRYPSAADLAADLRRFLSGEPTRVRPVGPAARVRWWWFRNPARAAVTLASGAAAVAVAAAGLLAWLWLTDRATGRGLADRAAAAADERAELRRRQYADGIRRAGEMFAAFDRAAARAELDRLRPGPGEDDLRGFEWHYLARAAAGPPDRVLLDAGGPVYAVAYRPDGGLVAAGGGGRVRFLDPATGAEEVPGLSVPGDVACLAFAPDGTQVAAGCGDGAIRVWVPGRAVPRLTLTGHRGKPAVAWSPDGRRLASGSKDGTVRLWDVATGGHRELYRDTGTASVQGLAWSPDGRRLAAAGFRIFQVFDPDTGDAFLPPDQEFASDGAVAFRPDGGLLAVARDGAVRAWRPAADGRGWTPNEWEVGDGRARLAGGARADSLSLTRNRALAAVCRDDQVVVWRVARPAVAASLPAGGRVWSAAVSPLGDAVVTGGADGRVRVWALGAARLPLMPEADASFLAFDPAGRRLAAGGRGGAQVWALGDGDTPPVEKSYPSYPAAGGFGADGSLVVCDHVGLVCRWEGDRWIPLRQLVPPWKNVDPRKAVLAPGGRWLAVWPLAPDTVRVWSLPDGRERVHSARAVVNQVAVSAGGRVAVAWSDNAVRVWDADGGAGAAALRCDAPPTAVALGPGGVVAAGCGPAVLVWDDVTAPTPRRLSGAGGPVGAVAVSPDGRTVAAGDDTLVRLWRLDIGQEVLTIPGHALPVSILRFSPDGRRLASAAGDPGGWPRSEILVHDAGDWLSPPPR